MITINAATRFNELDAQLGRRRVLLSKHIESVAEQNRMVTDAAFSLIREVLARA